MVQGRDEARRAEYTFGFQPAWVPRHPLQEWAKQISSNPVKTGGQTVVVRKEGEQTAFSAPTMSPARTAVAAQAMFANCCTSYNIPLQLVVYAGGRAHRFTGVGWPIFQWGFADGGTHIAFGQEPVHFACATHYEMRDIESERLIEAIEVPQPCGQIRDLKPVKIPEWVARLISTKRR